MWCFNLLVTARRMMSLLLLLCIVTVTVAETERQSRYFSVKAEHELRVGGRQTFSRESVLKHARASYTRRKKARFLRQATKNTRSLLSTISDDEPPQFIDGCPSDIKITDSALGFPTIARYSLPNVTDNSGGPVEVAGYPPAGHYSLSLGSNNVTVMAIDSAGNVASCQFKITKEPMPCRDPRSGLSETDPITYTCPNGFVDGATCSVGCADGSEPRGATSVICRSSGKYHNPASLGGRQWSRSDDTVPYCQEKCSPGQWSATGNQPCNLCPYGSYQTKYGQTSCDVCPYGMWTIVEGAVNKNDCIFFEWSVNKDATLPEMKFPETSLAEATALFWVRLRPQAKTRMRLNFFINPEGRNAIGAGIVKFKNFGVYVKPEEDHTSRTIRYWYHVALVIDKLDGSRKYAVLLYLNGKLKENVFVDDELNLSSMDKIELDFVGTAILWTLHPVEVYGLQMTGSALDAAEIEDLSNDCHRMLDSNFLTAPGKTTYKDFYNPRPSLCVDPNDCNGNPCGKHGVCLDNNGYFSCECDPPWTGKLCDIPDYCQSHKCGQGATCINTYEHSNYTCVCVNGSTGPLCNDGVDSSSESDESNADNTDDDDDFQLVGIAGVAAGCGLFITVILLGVFLVLRRQRQRKKRTVLNPYDKPGPVGEEGDYLKIEKDPYDSIEDDPYATCQEVVLDNDDGYSLVRDDLITDSSQANDSGISSGTYKYTDRDVTQPEPRPEDSTSQASPNCDSDGYTEVMDSSGRSSARKDDAVCPAQPKFGDENCKSSGKRALPPPGIFDNDGIVPEK